MGGLAVGGFVAIDEGLRLQGDVVAVEAAGTYVVDGGSLQVGGGRINEATVGEGVGCGKVGQTGGGHLPGGGVVDVVGV